MSPSISRKQQKMMGMGLAMKRGKMPMKGRAGMMAKHMTEKEMEEFASTKFSDLPMRAKKKTTKSKKKSLKSKNKKNK